jgi:3-methyladenine DNA glycosylase/8-oxoguanine DNA glycosylase
MTQSSTIRSAHLEVDPFDLHATFEKQLLGKFDPTGARGERSIRKIHLDGAGNVIVWRFTQTDTGLLVEVDGDNGRLLEVITQQFPLNDGAHSFSTDHPLLQRLSKGYRGLRLMRMPWTFDVAAGAVLQQRVRWQVGYTDFKNVALRWGTRAQGAVAFPTSAQLANVPVARLESIGIDPKRARTLHLLACADVRHPFLHPDADHAEVNRRLLLIPGIGPWTAGLISGVAFGNPDAVPIGDLHIPSLVTFALAGEPEGTDQRMLELLEPYAGQRFRVIRLLSWGARRVPHVFRETATCIVASSVPSPIGRPI